MVVLTEMDRSLHKYNIIWHLVRLIGKFHVVLFIQTIPDCGIWTMVDTHSQGVDIQSVVDDDMVEVLIALDYVDRVIVEVPLASSITYGAFELFSCVNFAKRVLSIKDWRIITPLQLFRRLQDGS